MSQIAVQSRGSRFPERRAQRRMDALERGAVSFGQSLEERVKILDSRLGVGVGATKERLKLAAKVVQRDRPTRRTPRMRNRSARRRSSSRDSPSLLYSHVVE